MDWAGEGNAQFYGTESSGRSGTTESVCLLLLLPLICLFIRHSIRKDWHGDKSAEADIIRLMTLFKKIMQLLIRRKNPESVFNS
jgi:hypothetical protein